MFRSHFYGEELPPPCQITSALKEKLKSIGYEEPEIPHVVRALCFQTYRKKPKKGYRYLMLGVDEFGLVDCGGYVKGRKRRNNGGKKNE